MDITTLSIAQRFTKDYVQEQIKKLPQNGVNDYTQLKNKPKINGVELDGDKTLEDLGIPTGSGSGEQVDTFTVVAEGGEMFIGFTYEELGMRDMFDCKALQLWAHNLGYSSETLTGNQKVNLKSNNGTYSYGLLFTTNQPCACLENNADSNQFTTSKISIPNRYEEHSDAVRRKELPVGVVSLWNVNQSTPGAQTFSLSPSQYNSGLYIWINTNAVWTAGSTFHVKIWR